MKGGVSGLSAARAESVGSVVVGGGRGVAAPAAVSCRNDAFVGGQDVVDHVVDAEVVH